MPPRTNIRGRGPHGGPHVVFHPRDIEDYFDIEEEAEILEYDDEQVEDEEEDDDDDDDDEDDESEEEEEEEDYLPIIRTNGRVSPNTRLNPARRIVFEDDSEPQPIQQQGQEDSKIESEGIIIRSTGESSGSGNDNEGVCCPICMESWSSEGGHQVCCLPCGHVYGFSCIEKWIRQCKRNCAKCPQCSRKCGIKDIIKLYISRIAVVDGEQQKKVLSLHAENEFLKMKIASLQERICQEEEEKMLKDEASCLENMCFGEMRGQTSEFIAKSNDSHGQTQFGHTSTYGGQGSLCCSLKLEEEFVVDGARVFDMDTSNRALILARRLPGMGGTHVLTKMSMMYPYESETIQLPISTKAVKDLHVSPCGGKLALFASLGKKLSILSLESNNIVLTYDLPGPAWSCSWDVNGPQHLYAGLQDGTILMFDMRQTARPIESINGLSRHPIHTLHSLVQKSTTPCDAKTLLSASSIGPCVWNTGSARERPFLLAEMENQGVCISLAHCLSTDDIVASFRPKVQTSNDIINTQPSLSPSPTVLGRGILGSHVLIKRVGGNCYQNLGCVSANVNDVRMLKSAIVKIENCNPMFAYGDEFTRGLSLLELPSLKSVQSLKPHQHPILDVKYAASIGSGILGCVSEDRLQLFAATPV
ncbi:hypothetical protein AQUCO_06200005v1 [Aquilegia coerulea]|uniref:RING-type E3 ubiquitin transferase n=1 Tax=Aquilegia coerulea TaxID=218851 RepID=A0A2G5CE33_AQUCA|nr:hypothetical protein AQUCO_06200005v1 [Aquilegia coerulea]